MDSARRSAVIPSTSIAFLGPMPTVRSPLLFVRHFPALSHKNLAIGEEGCLRRVRDIPLPLAQKAVLTDP